MVDDLTEHQAALLRGLVRQAIRKAGRGQAALREKFGAAYDGHVAGRLGELEEIYRKLGGDPRRITNREEHDEQD